MDTQPADDVERTESGSLTKWLLLNDALRTKLAEEVEPWEFLDQAPPKSPYPESIPSGFVKQGRSKFQNKQLQNDDPTPPQTALVGEPFEHRFKRQPSDFFVVGRVFAMQTELLKSLSDRRQKDANSIVEPEQYLDDVHSVQYGADSKHIKIMVIVRKSSGLGSKELKCECVPVCKDSSRATFRPGTDRDKYAIVCANGNGPSVLPEGQLKKDSFPVFLSPTSIKDDLDLDARIDVGRTYTIDRNAKLNNMGMIAKSHMSRLSKYWFIAQSHSTTASTAYNGNNERTPDASSLLNSSKASSFPSKSTNVRLENPGPYSSGDTILSEKDLTQRCVSLLLKDEGLVKLYDRFFNDFDLSEATSHHEPLLEKYLEELFRCCEAWYQRNIIESLNNKNRRGDFTESLRRRMIFPGDVSRPQAVLDQTDRSSEIEWQQVSHTLGLQSLAVTGDRNKLQRAAVIGNSDRVFIMSRSELANFDTMFIQGDSFNHYKTSLTQLLYAHWSPKSLEGALSIGIFEIIELYVDQYLEQIAVGEYEWLLDLKEVGYTPKEIAEVLWEGKRDTPWIFFVPQDPSPVTMRYDFHIKDCAHSNVSQYVRLVGRKLPAALQDLASSNLPTCVQPPTLNYADKMRQIESLCGLGGIIPFSQNQEEWKGRVKFSEKSSNSFVSYSLEPISDDSKLYTRVGSILERLSKAAAVAQEIGLCCSCFSIFECRPGRLTSEHDQGRTAKLRSIPFTAIEALRKMFLELELERKGFDTRRDECLTVVKFILGELLPEDSSFFDNLHHFCCVAAQLLCIGFLSYIHGHSGPLDPFFLDTAQEKIVLGGSLFSAAETNHRDVITCAMIDLTCLKAMIKRPILVFHQYYEDGVKSAFPEKPCDISARADDLLDIWGPGRIYCSSSEATKAVAISIGGGLIYQPDPLNAKLHWAQNPSNEEVASSCFSFYDPLRVGAIFEENHNCGLDKDDSRLRHQAFLGHLGTREPRWVNNERQFGFTGGQYLSANFNGVWKLDPGTPLKALILQERSSLQWLHDLDSSWGLYISLCTGIAYRVRLRELVADLLPKFIGPQEFELWEQLKTKNVINAFKSGDLKKWTAKLGPELCTQLKDLVKDVIGHLEDTGLHHSEKHLTVAWPHQDNLRQCLRIPCEDGTYWTRMLADSSDCATFACITTKCMQTEHIKCQAAGTFEEARKLVSESLVTEFSCVVPLEHNKSYLIKGSDTFLVAKVEVLASRQVPHVIIRPSAVKGRFYKRLVEKERSGGERIIRERQSPLDKAEQVVVSSLPPAKEKEKLHAKGKAKSHIEEVERFTELKENPCEVRAAEIKSRGSWISRLIIKPKDLRSSGFSDGTSTLV